MVQLQGGSYRQERVVGSVPPVSREWGSNQHWRVRRARRSRVYETRGCDWAVRRIRDRVAEKQEIVSPSEPESENGTNCSRFPVKASTTTQVRRSRNVGRREGSEEEVRVAVRVDRCSYRKWRRSTVASVDRKWGFQPWRRREVELLEEFGSSESGWNPDGVDGEKSW